MKKIIPFVLLLLLSASSFGQQTMPSQGFTKQDYLQKSKKQKKTATIFLAVGASLVITAFVIPKGEPTGLQFGAGGVYDGHKNDGIKGAFILAGGLSMLGSIPFFIASGKNKKRAMRMSFKNQTIPQLQKNNLAYKAIPSLNFKISL